MREWIAEDRGVSVDREMELLAQVGHDLPGAVRVLPHEAPPSYPAVSHDSAAGGARPTDEEASGWRFSLAGVALKFSMLAVDDRLTMPAFGEAGDWIVKLPDRMHENVPHNEYTMMSLASAVGIEVPEVRFVHRENIHGLPSSVWAPGQEWAYAVRRFDRDEQRRLIHAEDLAQVRNVYAERKYLGNYETVASLFYRGHDVGALREFARRLAFDVLITNGDAHLKNWSLIYRDPRFPSIAPAYDLVATGPYRRRADGQTETLALKFGGSKRFTDVSLHTFTRVQHRLGATDAELADCVADLVRRVRAAWPDFAERIDNPDLMREVELGINEHARSLCRSVGTNDMP